MKNKLAPNHRELRVIELGIVSPTGQCKYFNLAEAWVGREIQVLVCHKGAKLVTVFTDPIPNIQVGETCRMVAHQAMNGVRRGFGTMKVLSTFQIHSISEASLALLKKHINSTHPDFWEIPKSFSVK